MSKKLTTLTQQRIIFSTGSLWTKTNIIAPTSSGPNMHLTMAGVRLSNGPDNLMIANFEIYGPYLRRRIMPEQHAVIYERISQLVEGSGLEGCDFFVDDKGKDEDRDICWSRFSVIVRPRRSFIESAIQFGPNLLSRMGVGAREVTACRNGWLRISLDFVPAPDRIGLRGWITLEDMYKLKHCGRKPSSIPVYQHSLPNGVVYERDSTQCALSRHYS